MKKTLFFIFLVLGIAAITVVLTIVPRRDRLEPETFIPDSPQWHLPDGVKARVGKGTVNDLAYSPDGTIFAVASSVGIWFYDVHSGKEFALLAKNREGVIAYRLVLMEKHSQVLAAINLFAYGMLKPANSSRHLWVIEEML